MAKIPSAMQYPMIEKGGKKPNTKPIQKPGKPIGKMSPSKKGCK